MEVHGYNQFGSIDATIDGQFMTIPDDMANRHRYMIWDEWEMGPPDEEGNRERVNTIAPYVEPELPPQPYRLFKSVFIRRLTEVEAATMEGVLAAAPAKLRLLFNSVEYFVSDDEMFDDLHAAIAGALSAQRADELLAEDVA